MKVRSGVPAIREGRQIRVGLALELAGSDPLFLPIARLVGELLAGSRLGVERAAGEALVVIKALPSGSLPSNLIEQIDDAIRAAEINAASGLC